MAVNVAVKAVCGCGDFLRWEDVDLKAGRLRVRHTLANVAATLTQTEPKTHRSRRLFVLPEVVRSALRVAGLRRVDRHS